jgi:peroxiredoxin
MHSRPERPTIVLILMTLLVTAAGPAPDLLRIGQKAPEFTLTDVMRDGAVSLKETVEAHELTVVLWVGIECPYSNACNEDFERFYRTYAEKGVAFLGLNSNSTEPVEEVRRHAEENGFSFPMLDDDGNKVADAFGANFTPELWILDKTMTARFHGGLIFRGNDKGIQQHFTDALDALLEGKDPPRTETRAFGCTITRVYQ